MSGAQVFFHISLQEESLLLMEVRQNLSSEVSQEPFDNTPCARLISRQTVDRAGKKTMQKRTEMGKSGFKPTVAKKGDLKGAVKSLSCSSFHSHPFQAWVGE